MATPTPVVPGQDSTKGSSRSGKVTTIVVLKLDWLARSVLVPAPSAMISHAGGINLPLGGQTHGPDGQDILQHLATFAEFEVDRLRMRTREGMAIVCARGGLKGHQPKLSMRRQTGLPRMPGAGDCTIIDLAEVFKVSRPAGYRTLQRLPEVVA